MLHTPSWRIVVLIMLFGLSANGQTIQQQIATQIFKTDTSITQKTGAKSISAIGVGGSDTSILHIMRNLWDSTAYSGVSQIYNYYGTVIVGSDSIKVDTTLIQTKLPYAPENVANKIGSNGPINSTNYYNASATNTLNAAIYTATADSVSGRVKYIDSLTVYATPKNVKDSANSVRSAIPTNNNQLTNGSNFAVAGTTLAAYGITDAYTKAISDGKYFIAANANTSGNAITLEYFNSHSTPATTVTLAGDVTGVGTNTVTTTIKADVALSGNPTAATQSAGNSSTRIATTAFAMGAIATATAVCVPYTGATTNVALGANSLYTTANIGIGTTSPATPLEVVETSTVTPRGLTNSQYSNGNNSAQYHFRKSRGTPSVPLTVATGDVIGRAMFEAYDGSNFLTMAEIRAVVTGSVTTTRTPTYISLYTATDATPSVMTERLRIDENGAFNYFGSTSGTYTFKAPAAVTNYTITPPSTVGAAGQTQAINSVSASAAILGWITPITSVSVTATPVFSVSGSPIASATGTINIAYAPVFTITDAANFVFDGNNGGVQKITLGAARTFTLTNLVVGPPYNLWVTHGTSTTITWGTSVKSEWNTAGIPPQSTGNGDVDLYIIRYNGTITSVETHLKTN